MAKKEVSKSKPLSLEELRDSIEKDIGKGSLMIGDGSVVRVDSFSTGVPSIDLALGCGGLPIGRTIEIFGGESSGKTTTCLQFIAACQNHYFKNKNRNGRAAIVDAEHALDVRWAAKVGVNTQDLLISQPNSGEEALMIVERLVESGMIDLVVVDSVAALVPKAVLDGELTDQTMAALAQLMSKAMNRLTSKCNNNQATVIFINQIREKVGIVFGSPELTPGGRALKFYSSVRIEVRKGSPIKQNDVVVGFRPTLKIIKNKVAAPFRTCEFDICVGTKERPIYGIDTLSSLIEAGLTLGVISKSGSWICYGDNKLGLGVVNAMNAVKQNSALLSEIQDKIYSKMRENNNNLEVVVDEDESSNFDHDES